MGVVAESDTRLCFLYHLKTVIRRIECSYRSHYNIDLVTTLRGKFLVCVSICLLITANCRLVSLWL